jgi:hypothetical protein
LIVGNGLSFPINNEISSFDFTRRIPEADYAMTRTIVENPISTRVIVQNPISSNQITRQTIVENPSYSVQNPIISNQITRQTIVESPSYARQTIIENPTYNSGVIGYSKPSEYPIVDGLIRRSVAFPESEIKRSIVIRESEKEDVIKRSGFIRTEPAVSVERREVIKRSAHQIPEIKISAPTEKVVSTKEDIEYVSVQVPVHKQSQIIERVVEVPVEIVKEKVNFFLIYLNACLIFNIIMEF